MPTLEAAIQQVQSDPTFTSSTPDEQTQYLSKFVLPKVDPTFTSSTPDEQKKYIQKFILPRFNLKPVQLQPSIPTQNQATPQNSFTDPTTGITAYSNPQLQEQANQGSRAGVSSVIKGASLGYADPWPLKNPTPDQQNTSNALSFMGSIFPYEATGGVLNKVAPGGGFLGALARPAASAGLVGGAESLPGNQGDIGQRLKNAGTGALIGGGLHLGGEFLGNLAKFLPFMPKEAPPVRQFQGITKPEFTPLNGRVFKSEAPTGVFKDKAQSLRVEAKKINWIKTQTRDVIKDVSNHQGIDEATTSRERRKELKTIHDTWEEVYQNETNPRVKTALRQAQAKLAYEHGNYDYKALLKEERASQARQRKLEAETARIQKLEDKQAATLQNLRDKQTLKDNLALEKAESKNRQREMRQLKASIQENVKVSDLQAKQAAQSDKALNKAEEENRQRRTARLRGDIREREAEKPEEEQLSEKQSTASKLKQIRAAIDKGHGLNLEYEAEKTGETGVYRHKTVSPYSVEINKSGVVQVRAINDEGQIRTYLLGDESGSKIVSAESTRELSPHEAITNPETGKITAKVREGAEVEQLKKTGVKSSELKAHLEKVKDVFHSKNPTVEEIMNASRGLDAAELKDALKDVSKEDLDNMCEGLE